MADDRVRDGQFVGDLAILTAEVRDHADNPDNVAVRDQLLETVAMFERVINRLARPRPN